MLPIRTLPIPVTLWLSTSIGIVAQHFAPDPLQGFPSPAGSTTSLVAVDADADGDQDLLLGRGQGLKELWRNDGHGLLSRGPTFGTTGDRNSALAVGDVNGDRRVDVFVANAFQQNRLFLATATGSFVDASGRLPVRTAGSQAAVMADVDGDRDLDILVGDQNQPNKLLRNNGSGVFTDVSATQLPNDSGNTTTLVPFDADGDGDLDLFVGNDRTGNRLWLNDGQGRFTNGPSLPGFGDATFAAAAGDADGDGRPDLFLANGLGANRLYRNLGSGRFTDISSNLPTNNNANFAVAFEDADADGDLDLALGVSFGQDELWLNDGSGRFVDATTRLPQAANATRSAALVDLDQDGDRELVFGGSTTAVFANFTRHLTATGTLQVGRTWTLEFARNRGFATRTAAAVPALAVGPRPVALPLPPLGNLLLDPGSVVALPPVMLGTPSGTGALGIPVPADPTLANRQISAQAVVVPTTTPLAARFTNAITAIVRP